MIEVGKTVSRARLQSECQVMMDAGGMIIMRVGAFLMSVIERARMTSYGFEASAAQCPGGGKR